MCLAVLCAEYFPLDFLGEYIQIGFQQGRIHARETYDVFFRSPLTTPKLTLYLLSPHNLISGQEVSVKLSKTPGSPDAGESLAGFYPNLNGPTSGFDSRDGGVFWIERPVAMIGRVGRKAFRGRVLWGKAKLPEEIVNHGLPESIELMRTVGTLSCVELPQLTKGESYALRIVVEPVELVNLPAALSMSTGVPDQPQTQWKQFATVIDPMTCRFNFERLLSSAMVNDDWKKCKPLFELILNNAGRYTLPVDHHRIAVLCPPDCELDVDGTIGDCASDGKSVITEGTKKPYMIATWVSGRVAYPHSHPETSASVILSWLVDWGQNQPKSKEEITTAVDGDHQNVSLLVDALVKHKLIVEDKQRQGVYLPVTPLTPHQRAEGLRRIATDDDVLTKLVLKGYEVQYDLTYFYLTPADQRYLDEQRTARTRDQAQNRTAYQLAWIGIILAIISILIALIQWLLS